MKRPPASSADAEVRMKRQLRRDTEPELAIRRLLHSRSVRYRVDARLELDLRVRGDIVLRGIKVVVFVDGCFWHGCPIHATAPRANAEWWREKLDANATRDRRTDVALTTRGWTVMRLIRNEGVVVA